MQLLLTDITEMKHGHFCVAGWDAVHKRMVRPLPGGSHWTEKLIKRHGFTTGHRYYFDAIGPTPDTQFPHRTEDTAVHAFKIKRLSDAPIDWAAAAPAAAKTLAEAFDHQTQISSVWQGYATPYVPHACQVRSLHGLHIAPDQLDLYQQGDKLRAHIDDGVRSWSLPVPCRALREMWRNQGIDAIKRAWRDAARLHVRLGLARAWAEHPDKCFIMLNGVHY